MIRSVTVINQRGEVLPLILTSPEDTGLNVKNISGLGPVKATINTSSASTIDGSRYNSARAAGRNVVFDLGFLEVPDIETVRQRTYQFFPIKKNVQLVFETDNRTVYTSGYVESNVPNIFSKEEGTQISVVCPDSYFYGLDENLTTFSSISGGFEFPFSNDSLTTPLLEFSAITNTHSVNIWYEGEVEVGFLTNIHALGPVTNITLTSERSGDQMTIDTGKIYGGIVAGDDIIISTIKGEKSVYLLRNGVYSNILNAVGRYSSWFALEHGDNALAFIADEGASNLQFSITNRVVYEGV